MAAPNKPGPRVVVELPTAPTLSPEHRAHLKTSGLTNETIDANGFYSEANGKRIASILGWRRWSSGAVIVLPFFEPGASEPTLCRVRPDKPRTKESKGRTRTVKYEQPKGVPLVPYFPVGSRTDGRLKDVSKPLVFTEGEKKAALLDQLGFAVVGAAGVSNFHDKPHRDDNDEWRLHPWITNHCTLSGRVCLICFDSDAAEKDEVMRAAGQLAGMIHAAGGIPRFVSIPSDGDNKLGIDDFFVKFGEDATRALLANAGPIDPLPTVEIFTLVGHVQGLKGAPVHPKLRIPFGYEISRDGRLWKKGEHEDELIERSVILIRRVMSGLYTGDKQVEICFVDAGEWRTALVSRRAISDARAIMELAAIGAPVDTNTASKVVTWLRDFEHVNDRRLPRTVSVDTCGWHGDGRFMLGGQLIKRDDDAGELVFDARGGRQRLVSGLGTRGTYEAHLEALRRAWDTEPLAALAICGALAAPLLRPLRAPSFGIHLAGDSSRGKSSMLKIGASVFGDPANEDWVASWNSTAVGHEVRAVALDGLPFLIDEAGVADARSRERDVYMIINGVGRVRGARDGGLRDTRSWQTVMISTGEAMLAPEDAATGAQVRILQFRVEGFGGLDAAGVDAVRREAEENFGHVGREWLEGLCNVVDWEPYREAYRATARAFQSEVTGPRGRQAGFFALLAVAEMMAAEVLGLGSAKGETIHRLMLNADDAQEEVLPAADRALSLLAEWMLSKPASFPALRIDPSGAKVPADKGAREVFGFVDEERVLVIPGPWRAHLAEHGIDSKVVLSDWRRRGWTAVTSGDRLLYQCRIAGRRGRFVAVDREVVGIDAPDVGSQEFADW